MNKASEWSRRDALKFALAASASATMLGRSASAAGGTVNFADIGVGDPGGDWSRYTATSGYDVNLVSIGNAPSAILNVLIAGGGTGTYDIINIVGGMQKPLVDNDLIEELDTSRMPNWVDISSISTTSIDLPLVEKATMRSSSANIPRSP